MLDYCSSPTATTTTTITIKVATTMHCNLWPPDVPPVLGFNYEADDTPAYKFNTSTTSVKPQCTHTPNFSEIELYALSY